MTQTAVYMYDPSTLIFTGSKLVDDGYQVQEGETTLQPTDGLYQPIKFSNGTWVGTPQADWETQQKAEREAYLAEHPEEAPQPSAEQQMIMQQDTDITSLKKAVMYQASQIASLTKGSAE